MIRVCYLVDAEFLGGAERYVSRVAMGLDRRHFLPSVIMGIPRGEDDGGLSGWADRLEAEGIRVSRVEMNLPFRPWQARRVLETIESHRPRVAHINMPGPYNGQMGLLAPLARLAGSAVVTTEHLPMVAPLWKRALVRRFCNRFVDVVMTVCRANVPYLRAHGVRPERVVVVPNGIRDDFGTAPVTAGATRADWGIDPDAVVVLFIGNLLRHKGLHRVIRALSEVDDPAWHLVVAGRGPEEDRCRARLRELGLDARATFLGAVSAGAVEGVLAASDVLALPSTIEGMPYVIIEAMASGLPVVAGNVFGIPELIEDGVHGRLVPPTDREALRSALAELIADGARRRRLGAAARERFRGEFTLSRQVAAIEVVYRRLAGVGT